MEGRIVFVFPKSESLLNDSPWFPLGILYLGEIAKPNGFEVELIDERWKEVKEKDLIGAKALMLSVTTANVNNAQKLSSIAKKNGIPVVAGGIHVSSVDVEETLSYADCVVTGQAVHIFSEILQDLKQDSLKPIYRGGKVSENFFNEMPIISRNLISKSTKYLPTFLASIGCPYTCTFCAVPKAHGYLRRPVEQIVKEISLLDTNEFTFVDDNLLGSNPEEAVRLFKEIKKLGRDFKFFGNFDISIVKHKHVIEEFIKAGGQSIFIGLESLNPDNLKFANKLSRIPFKINRPILSDDVKRYYSHGKSMKK